MSGQTANGLACSAAGPRWCLGDYDVDPSTVATAVSYDDGRAFVHNLVRCTTGADGGGPVSMADPPLDSATRLAVERTRLALERTTMAWIRTSTSLIAFGFTIFKFFQYQATENHHRPVVSPWIVGMVMIGLGVTALSLAWVQHRQELKVLRTQDPDLPYSLAGIMAGLIATLGLLALVVVAFRI